VGGIDLFVIGFEEPSQKSMAAVLTLETERINAMTKLGFMT
jgi:hypothetical protein